jgi:hypothetical protein
MPVDINGYALSNSGGDLLLGASTSKIIAANYGIKDPTLPAMFGSVTDGSATYKVYPWPINDVVVNNGSSWSVSTFRFTAPVAGIYYTSFAGITGVGTSGSFGGYYALIVNGVNNYFGYRGDLSLWELLHIEMQIKLAAGDTVGWAMNITPAPDSGTTGGAYRSNHNHSTIWLVG